MKALLLALVLAACGLKDELPSDVFHSPRWALTLGGSGADSVYVVAFDPAGDVLAAGGFSGAVGFGSTTLGSYGQQGGFLTKRAAADGHEKWTIQIGVSGELAGIGDLSVDEHGGLTALGMFLGELHIGRETLRGEDACFLAKFDGNGGVIWARSIAASTATQCVRMSVGSGRIAVVGRYVGSLTLPSGTFQSADHDTFLMLFDDTGSLLWGLTVPNVPQYLGGQTLFANGVSITPAGDVLVAGGIRGTVTVDGIVLSSTASQSRFVARVSATGKVISAEVLGVEGAAYDPTALASGAGGSSVLLSTRSRDGFSQGAPVVSVFDENGYSLWERSADSRAATTYAMTVLDDGTIVMSGGLFGYVLDPGSGSLPLSCAYLLAYAPTSELRDALPLGPRDCISPRIADSLATGPSAFAMGGYVREEVDLGTGALPHAGDTDGVIQVFDVP